MDNLYHHINKYMIRIPLSPNSNAELQPDEQEMWLKDLCQNELFREQILISPHCKKFNFTVLKHHLSIDRYKRERETI